MTTADDAEKADDLERHARILDLAKLLIRAGEALHEDEFEKVQRLLADGARQARVLVLMEKEKEA